MCRACLTHFLSIPLERLSSFGYSPHAGSVSSFESADWPTGCEIMWNRGICWARTCSPISLWSRAEDMVASIPWSLKSGSFLIKRFAMVWLKLSLQECTKLHILSIWRSVKAMAMFWNCFGTQGSDTSTEHTIQYTLASSRFCGNLSCLVMLYQHLFTHGPLSRHGASVDASHWFGDVWDVTFWHVQELLVKLLVDHKAWKWNCWKVCGLLTLGRN